MNLYILSGLGADERVFKNLDFGKCTAVFIKWISPLPDESIESYAARLLPQISEQNPTLLGLSFGGMMAIEIAKQIRVHKIVQISSAKERKEIPFYFRMMNFLKRPLPIPEAFFRKPSRFNNWVFGLTDPADKALLFSIIKDTDPAFFKWAIYRIINWKNEQHFNNLISIHGSADRILPIWFITCDHKITGGGHLMLLNKAHELSALIRKYLE